MTVGRSLLGLASIIGLMWTGTALAGPIEVIPRPAWGSRDAGEGCRPHIIKAISVHHTATHNTDNSTSPKRLRGYQRYHQSDKGWIDVAYHLFIDLDGNVYEGRAQGCVGDTSTNYDPTGHLLVVLEGNFEKQTVSDAAFQSLIEVVTWGAQKYGVAADQIRGHRELAATACPGADLFRYFSDGSFHGRVEASISAGPQTLSLLSEQEGRLRIEHIEGVSNQSQE
jgi:hypothetical protein